MALDGPRPSAEGARPCPSGHGGKGEATLPEALEARATRWGPPIGERRDSVARIPYREVSSVTWLILPVVIYACPKD